MGNRLSTKVLRKKRRKQTRGIQRLKNGKEKNYIYKCEGGLEIEEICETEELRIKPAHYWEGNEDCSKSKRHGDYIAFESLALHHLPDPIRHTAVYNYIRARGNLVVHIEVPEKSQNRKETKAINYGHCASGFARVSGHDRVEVDCPLYPNCRFGDNSEHNHKVFGGIVVMTNKHVIIDNFECEKSRFSFFYESGDSPKDASVLGHGFCLRDDSSENKDYVGVKIFFHDASAVDRIRQFSSEADDAWHQIPEQFQREFENHSVVISHPHSWPKQVSFGQLLEKELLLDHNQNEDKYDDYFKDFQREHGIEASDEKKRQLFLPGRRMSRYTSMTCCGSSGSPVLSGLYWDNPFIHSSGFKRVLDDENGNSDNDDDDDEEEDKPFEIWGESYFY